MSITLRKIDALNFESVISLSVTEEQSQFVAPNIYSIAQSKIYDETTIKAIYKNEDVVGFVMYGRDNESEKREPWLIRFMVDARFQKQGIGRIAMQKILNEMQQHYEGESIYLSTGPNNFKVITFYESFGFVYTNIIQHDEAVYVLNVNK